MAANQILSLPAAAAGLQPVSSATAWLYGTALDASTSLPTDIDIIGLAFQNIDIPSVDATQEILFDITVGGTTKLQVPYSFRQDTNVGYYLDVHHYYFPEPYFVPAGSALAVKVTDSVASALTYHGVKILYREAATATTVLNTPADAGTVNTTTPTLNFTGTSDDSIALEYNVQIDTVNTFDSQVGSPTTLDSYSESNTDQDVQSDNTTTGNAQSFTPASTGTLGSVKFWLKKVGSPTGNAICKIYAHSGTYGTSSVPTGAALASSANFDVTTLTTSYQLITFTFSGANQITLTGGTRYCVAFEQVSGANWPALNVPKMGGDSSSPTHGGNRAFFQTGSWSASSTFDLVFYVLTTAPNTPLLDKVSTTDAGFTAGHPFASAAAKDFTVQGGDALTNGNTYYWRARGKRTGSTLYGDWPTTRSFTVDTGGSAVKDFIQSGFLAFPR